MGYLKNKCKGCGKKIYLKEDYDGVVRPYESWIEGTVDEGEWVLHSCVGVKEPTIPTVIRRAPEPTPDPPQAMSHQSRSITNYCHKLMNSGVPLDGALDLLGKVAFVQDVLSQHGFDPLFEVSAMFDCFDSHYKEANEEREPPPPPFAADGVDDTTV